MIKGKKLIMGLVLSSILCSSSIYIFAKRIDNNIETVMDIETDDVEDGVYTLEDLEEIMNELRVQPYTVDYVAENESVKDKTFVNKTIELTDEYKYAKAFYSNNGSQKVNLIVSGTTISQTVPAGSGIGVVWEKSSTGNKTYTVSVSGNGSENLNGIISVGKSNVKDELKE